MDNFDELLNSLEFDEESSDNIADDEEELSEKELRSSYRQLRLLYNYFDRINSEIDYDVVINITIDFINSIYSFEKIVLLRIENDNFEILNPIFKRNISDDEITKIVLIINKDNLFEWTYQNQKIAFVNHNHENIYILPLMSDRDIQGFLLLLTNEDIEISRENLNLIRIFSQELGKVLDKAKLYDKLVRNEDILEIKIHETTQLYNELKNIFEFTKKIGQIFEEDLLLKTTLNMLASTFEVSKVYYFEKRNNILDLKMVVGDEFKGLKIDLESDLTVFNLLIENPQAINYFFGEKTFERFKLVGIEADTMLGAPLFKSEKIKNKVIEKKIGFILLADRKLNKPFYEKHVNLLTTLLKQVTYSLETITMHKEIVEQQKLKRDLELASQIQMSLLPKKPPNISGYQISSFFKPARMVGGDYFDFLVRGDNKIIGIIGDISGKGMPAAIMMATARSIIRSESLQPSFDISNAIFRINNLICDDIYRGRFLTLLYFVLRPEINELVFVSAGHNPLLYYNSKKGKLEELATGGIPLGLRKGENYHAQVIRLNENDFIFVYTDGLTEARNKNGEEFGENRLKEILLKYADKDSGEINEAVFIEWKAFTTDASQHDDTTFFTLKFKEADFSLKNKDSKHIILPSTLDNARFIVDKIIKELRNNNIKERIIFEIKLILLEIITNAVVHGNKRDETKKIEVSYYMDNRIFEVLIKDEGKGFDFQKYIEKSLVDDIDFSKTNNRGILLVHALSDDIRFINNGTTVYIKKDLRGDKK